MHSVLQIVHYRLKAQLENEKVQKETFRGERVGHVIPVCCGHTGHPSSEEAYMMELHLRAAGFMEPPNIVIGNNKSGIGAGDVSNSVLNSAKGIPKKEIHVKKEFSQNVSKDHVDSLKKDNWVMQEHEMSTSSAAKKSSFLPPINAHKTPFLVPPDLPGENATTTLSHT